MITLTRTHRAALAAGAQNLAAMVTLFVMAAVFTSRAHEREVGALRGEAVGLRNQLAELRGQLLAIKHGVTK